MERRQAYKNTFLDGKGKLSPEAKLILADLKRFCCATRPTIRVSPQSGMIDPIAMGVAEGRREVWNRMMANLHLDENLIINLFEGVN